METNLPTPEALALWQKLCQETEPRKTAKPQKPSPYDRCFRAALAQHCQEQGLPQPNFDELRLNN